MNRAAHGGSAERRALAGVTSRRGANPMTLLAWRIAAVIAAAIAIGAFVYANRQGEEIAGLETEIAAAEARADSLALRSAALQEQLDAVVEIEPFVPALASNAFSVQLFGPAGAVGRLYVGADQAVFAARGLPRLDAEGTYTLWLETDAAGFQNLADLGPGEEDGVMVALPDIGPLSGWAAVIVSAGTDPTIPRPTRPYALLYRGWLR